MILDTWLQTLRAMVNDKISKKAWNYEMLQAFYIFAVIAIEHFAFEMGVGLLNTSSKAIYTRYEINLGFPICQLNMIKFCHFPVAEITIIIMS